MYWMVPIEWPITSPNHPIFGRPFIKRFAQCYRTIVLSVCLSVMSVALVYCVQMVGWIKMKSRQHCVRWGTAPPIFGPCLLWPNGWMDQDATWYGGRSRPRPHCVSPAHVVRWLDHLDAMCSRAWHAMHCVPLVRGSIRATAWVRRTWWSGR